MLPSRTRSRRQKKATACCHCRQMKLKCDKGNGPSAPCRRCVENNISCTVDPAFRREAKRDRLDKMERELREMKRIIQAQALSKSAPNGTAPILDIDHPILTTPATITSPPGQANFIYLDVVLCEKSLEDVLIEPCVIKDLLDEYYQNYHPNFPILPDLPIFIQHYDSCNLLFWTVMAIGSKSSKTHSELYARLKEPVQRLASEFAKLENRCIGFVQALLLLCTWPFPYGLRISDKSWAFCGLATLMALQLGVHRPNHFTEFVYRHQQPEFNPKSPLDEEQISIHKLVWTACYIVNHSVFAKLGLPATISFDNTILSTLTSPVSMPEVIHHHLHIAHISARISNILGQNEHSSSGLLEDPIPFMRALNEELNVLESQYEPIWEPETKIVFLHAQLRLFSFAFMQDAIEPRGAGSSKGSGSSNAEFCICAYSSATKLASIAYSRSHRATYWTANVWQSIIYAAMFLLRIGERSRCYGLEEEPIQSAISQLRDLLSKHSPGPDDHMSRVCAIIDYLSRSNWMGAQKRRPMKFQSRGATSLELDTVWHAKERFKVARGEQPPDAGMPSLDTESWMLPSWEQTDGWALPPWEQTDFQGLDVAEVAWDSLSRPNQPSQL